MHAGRPLEDVSRRRHRIPSASGKILMLAAPGQVTWVTEGQHNSRGTGGKLPSLEVKGDVSIWVEIITGL